MTTYTTCPIWNEMLTYVCSLPQTTTLFEFLKKEKQDGKIIYPDGREIFNPYKLTSYEKTIVCIIGQDPYHDGTAHGLAFSSKTQYRPPSLKTIFEEVVNSYYKGSTVEECFKANNLTHWARQGVLLLNRNLSVQKANPGSHNNRGWDTFLTETIELLNQKEKPVIYMLWGKYAKSLKDLINPDHHPYILEADHPAAHFRNPNASFLGCNHFALANKYIRQIHKNYPPQIGWAIL